MANGRGYMLGRDEGEAVWMLGERLALKAGAEQTGGAFSLVEDRVSPGGGPPPHIHADEDEAFYVLEGELRVQCGDNAFTAGPDSFVFLPRGVAHAFSVVGDAPARFLALFSPAGIEHFFRELGEPASSLDLHVMHGPPDIDRVVRVAAKHHITLAVAPVPSA